MSEDNKLTPKENTNIELMSVLAEDKQTLEEVEALTSNKVQDQLKVFLIAQARNELTRVVKLTKFLDRLENSFIDEINSSLATNDLTLKQYGEIIEVITTLLTRSNEIISKVLKDDSLTMILTANYTEENTTTSIVSQLKDPHARERVRSVIQSILMRANTQTVSAEYTDTTETGDNNNG